MLKKLKTGFENSIQNFKNAQSSWVKPAVIVIFFVVIYLLIALIFGHYKFPWWIYGGIVGLSLGILFGILALESKYKETSRSLSIGGVIGITSDSLIFTPHFNKNNEINTIFTKIRSLFMNQPNSADVAPLLALGVGFLLAFMLMMVVGTITKK